MNADSETKKIADNVRADECIHQNVVDTFFERISEKNEPSSSKEAKNIACEVAWGDPDTFLCQGNEVPDHRFHTMFRVYATISIRNLIWDRIIESGTNRKKLINGQLPATQEKAIIDNFTGPFQFAEDNRIIWATEDDGSQQQNSKTDELIARLGMSHFKTDQNCVICKYERQYVDSTLHVPRSFDALDQPNFAIELRCDAETGTTKPIGDENVYGMPEAVHRNCTVPSVRLEYRTLS